MESAHTELLVILWDATCSFSVNEDRPHIRPPQVLKHLIPYNKPTFPGSLQISSVVFGVDRLSDLLAQMILNIFI